MCADEIFIIYHLIEFYKPFICLFLRLSVSSSPLFLYLSFSRTLSRRIPLALPAWNLTRAQATAYSLALCVRRVAGGYLE